MIRTLRRRRSFARAGLCILLIRVLPACHGYARLQGPLPAPGSKVKLSYEQPRTVVVHFGDRDSTVRAARQVIGTLRTVTADSVQLSSLEPVSGSLVAGRDVSDLEYAGGTATLPTRGAEIRVKKIAPVRTVLATCLGVGTAFVLLGALVFSSHPYATAY